MNYESVLSSQKQHLLVLETDSRLEKSFDFTDTCFLQVKFMN